jgi:hypothetical protein
MDRRGSLGIASCKESSLASVKAIGRAASLVWDSSDSPEAWEKFLNVESGLRAGCVTLLVARITRVVFGSRWVLQRTPISKNYLLSRTGLVPDALVSAGLQYSCYPGGHGIAEWLGMMDSSCNQIDCERLSQPRLHQLKDLSHPFLARVVLPMRDRPPASSTSGYIYRHWVKVAVGRVLQIDSLGFSEQVARQVPVNMAEQRQASSARPFTFVGYDRNAKGVPDTVRSHLMEARARNKREAQAQPKKSTQYAALPWRYGKKSDSDVSEGANTASGHIAPSKKAQKRLRRQNLVATPQNLGDSSQSSSERQSPVSSPGTSRSGSETGQPPWLTHADELAFGSNVQPRSPIELGEGILGINDWPNSRCYQGSAWDDSECASELSRMLRPTNSSTKHSEHERLVSLSAL